VCPRRDRTVYLILPILCALLIFVVLILWASDDVRTDPVYLGFYEALGAGWLGATLFVIPLLGISAIDDGIERRNKGVGWVISASLAAVTFCYSGANVGNGPGVEVVLFSALLATLAFFALWLVVELLTSASETITVERSLPAGIRLAGFLAAIGIILGKSVAGDWVSYGKTVTDFLLFAWPALLLAVGEIFVERLAGSEGFKISRPSTSQGIGAAYVAAAILYAFKWGA